MLRHPLLFLYFLARDVIYTPGAYATMSVSVSVTEVHWHIIANLRSKFRSKFTAHCGCSPHPHACGRIVVAVQRVHAGKRGGVISRYTSTARLSCYISGDTVFTYFMLVTKTVCCWITQFNMFFECFNTAVLTSGTAGLATDPTQCNMCAQRVYGS